MHGEQEFDVDETNIDSFYLFREGDGSCVTVIVGYDEEKPDVGSVLLCRFHKLLKVMTFVNKTSKNGQEFLEKLKSALGSQKIERKRLGGSSGKFKQASLLRLVDMKNTCPRKGPGGVFMRTKKNMTVLVYYVGCKKKSNAKFKREAKHTLYSVPVDGGKLVFSEALLDKYSFLFFFLCQKHWQPRFWNAFLNF